MFTADQTWAFQLATFLLFGIAVVEGVALLIGATISEWIDSHFEAALDKLHGPFEKALGWLYIGRVPFLVLLTLFLASFAMIGFGVNLLSKNLLGVWLTPWIGIPVAFFAALPIVRGCGAILAMLKLRDETFAVGFDSLLGRSATIVVGKAEVGFAAQAKVRNEHGQDLYVMVEPNTQGLVFDEGDSVLLIKQITGNRFAAIVNPHPEVSR